ncbi:winged helix-turn-helix domain-containing protein [Sphaerisporangium corydalis]|uniref:Winged helix-turn-helix domain-containing protein n=1 Tax=Sphaerisporangium corydalis TaxID=1441875 RepID=A0ABV9ETP6_9ACTN|nr:winged helix-turn-helix domain-containing protein [Sphaerisporangium corydalis]
MRIHFTADDLTRVSLAGEPDPLWEVLLSRFRLRDRVRPAAFTPWLAELRAHPERNARIKAGARFLDVLAPPAPYFPDFLTPREAGGGLADGLEAILRTPKGRLADELCLLAARHPLPGWVRPLAEGDVTTLTALCDGLRTYYEAAIAPCESLVRSSLAAERACRSASLLDAGVEGLLTGMSPLMSWKPPVLEVAYVVDKELRLDGRGLRLVPSYFCQRVPVSLADPRLEPVLIYPIEHRHRWSSATAGCRDLAALMGRNRSAVLSALDHCTTTTQLARRLQISPAAASRHTMVLREAGLIDTRRAGPAVLHSLTPLGTALLEGRTAGT